MPHSFTKTGPEPDIAAEAAGLSWLAQAETSGGARIARVLAFAPGRLDLEYVANGAASVRAAEAFGVALARTHAAGADHFGCPPAGYHGRGAIGRAPMTYAPAPQPSWGVFYAEYRLEPYLHSGELRRVFEPVLRRLRAGEFDVPQPTLVGKNGHLAARLHGDLWAGNVLWPPACETGAVLIDPAAHGGHAETDLAMLALFGAPHLDRIRAAYDEASPLAEGWRDRIDLHQLYPLLVHTVLFGGGYGHQAAAAACRYA